MDIVDFVRGMALHDVGKPYYLGTARHSRLGYFCWSWRAIRVLHWFL